MPDLPQPSTTAPVPAPAPSLAPPPAVPRLPVLVALSALAILPINMFVPSLPHIARDLGASFALVNVAIAGYAVASAVAHLLAGTLSDRFGRKPIALGALAIFTLASVGCLLAQGIVAFLVCRMLQATVIAGYAVSLAAIRDTSEPGAAASRIGYVSSAWALAPMLGPTVGGLLDAAFGWRACFAAFALLGLAGVYAVAAHLPETNHQRASSWAAQARGYGALGGSARFWAYALCMAFGIGALYTFLGGAPLVAAQAGTSSALLGVYLGMIPGGFMLGSYAVGRVGSRFAPLHLILAGRLLMCGGLMGGLALALAGVAHPLAFFGPCVCMGLGNGLTMPVINARVLSLHPGLAGTASGLAAAVTVVGAGLIAFAGGLAVSAPWAPRPQVAVLGVMLATASVSLLCAGVIARMERGAAA